MDRIRILVCSKGAPFWSEARKKTVRDKKIKKCYNKNMNDRQKAIDYVFLFAYVAIFTAAFLFAILW